MLLALRIWTVKNSRNRHEARFPSLPTRVGSEIVGSLLTETSSTLVSLSASPNKFEGAGRRQSLEAVALSPEEDLDLRNVPEVLNHVLRHLDELAEEELWRPKGSVGAKVGIGHHSGQGATERATVAGGLDQAGDGEGIFRGRRLTG
jgi:hypothetical protein